MSIYVIHNPQPKWDQYKSSRVELVLKMNIPKLSHLLLCVLQKISSKKQKFQVNAMNSILFIKVAGLQPATNEVLYHGYFPESKKISK